MTIQEVGALLIVLGVALALAMWRFPNLFAERATCEQCGDETGFVDGEPIAYCGSCADERDQARDVEHWYR